MTSPRNDIHDSVLAEIEARIGALQFGAPARAPDRGAWTQAEVETELAQLLSDRELLLAHWRTEDGAAPTPPVEACACGQAQPCPHALGLAAKYGLI